jgi:hypothetical protein
MEIDLKDSFETVEEGTHYKLPMYSVIDGKGIVQTENVLDLKFVRGSKLKDEEVEKREGTLHEHLLGAMISDLKFKNSLVPSREGSLVITKLEEAQQWLLHRQIDRKKREVEGTYKK